MNTSDDASQLLKDMGFNEKALRAAIKELKKGEKVTSKNREDTYNALEKYAKNLNKLAKDGKIGSRYWSR